MPKRNKRAKHSHHSQQQQHDGNDVLSHAEIWDDSALIRSWDEALKEYEFYHSIHAKGEDVEEVLRRIGEIEEGSGEWDEDGEVEGEEEVEEDGVGGEEHELEVGEVEDGEVLPTAKGENEEPGVGNTGPKKLKEVRPSSQEHHGGPSLLTHSPDHNAAPAETPAQDQTLENIKMAYYWAGYYSGLYDGQRQAAQGPGTGESGTQGQPDAPS